MNLDQNDCWEMFKVLVPIILFFLGLWFSYILKNIYERRRLKKLGSYYKTLVGILCLATTDQILHYQKTIKNLESLANREILVTKLVGLPIGSIKAIDNHDLYKIFIDRSIINIDKSTHLFSELTSSIEYIISVFASIDSHNSTFETAVIKFGMDWNNYQKNVINTINRLKIELVRNQKNPMEDPFINEASNILDYIKTISTEENNDINPTLIYENVILKLKLHLQNNTSDTRTAAINTDLTFWKISYDEISFKYSDKIKIYNEIIKQLNHTKRRIEQIMEIT